jgi:uncharacterized membrane protein YphA (DoxX/SURF4 family)
MMIKMEKLGKLDKTISKYAPTFLRLSLSIVFFYFGIVQLIRPETFVGWLPPEVKYIPISPTTFVSLNGGFETICAILLSSGLFRRIAAFLLGMHLLGITFTIGWTEIGVRDLGLALSTIAITLIQEDEFSLDHYFSRRKSSSTSTKTEE